MYYDMGPGYYILILAIAAGLGLIPANIAKKKGYSFGLWWFYGWMLFIVAIIHVNLIPDKNAPAYTQAGVPPTTYSNYTTPTYASPAHPVTQATNSSFVASQPASQPFTGAAPAAMNAVPVSDAFEQVKQYKELLDAGILTQEEFDQKKKQLLDI